MNEKIQHITPNYVQMDEMWGFVHTREPNLHKGDPEEWGSTMVWLALDSETKLIITHHIGPRNGVSAHAFVSDLRARTDGRYQVSSDQLNAYVGAMREHLGKMWISGSFTKSMAASIPMVGMAAAKLLVQSHTSKSDGPNGVRFQLHTWSAPT